MVPDPTVRASLLVRSRAAQQQLERWYQNLNLSPPAPAHVMFLSLVGSVVRRLLTQADATVVQRWHGSAEVGRCAGREGRSTLVFSL